MRGIISLALITSVVVVGPLEAQGAQPVGLRGLVSAPVYAGSAATRIAGLKPSGVKRGERAFLKGAGVGFVVGAFIALGLGSHNLWEIGGFGLSAALPFGVISALLFGG